MEFLSQVDGYLGRKDCMQALMYGFIERFVVAAWLASRGC